MVRWRSPSDRLLASLTTYENVGNLANIKAELLQRDRLDFDDGTFVEMVIWRVPTSVEGGAHHYKYRLFFGQRGERIVGYDNERPKGDHRHIDGREHPYAFTNVEALVADFLADVQRWRSR